MDKYVFVLHPTDGSGNLQVLDPGAGEMNPDQISAFVAELEGQYPDWTVTATPLIDSREALAKAISDFEGSRAAERT